MKRVVVFLSLVFLVTGISNGQTNGAPGLTNLEGRTPTSQWKGKRVAYLGDSMTQKWDTAIVVYWEYLSELMDTRPFVYGINGNQWNGIYRQALKLKKERGAAIDAILIFAGTNDYNHNIPLGNFYAETFRQTNFNGKTVTRKYRTLIENDTTFCGRINKVMAFLKANFPDQQIVIMTPIHRGFAKFNAKNVQPEERFANDLGLYIDAYVETLKKAASVWSVPLVDLYSLSGLYPMEDSNIKYFRNAKNDRLHPCSLGYYRLAKTIQYQLLALPSTFVSAGH